MANVSDRVTRIAADLVDSAAAEGARQSRSAKQQLDRDSRHRKDLRHRCTGVAVLGVGGTDPTLAPLRGPAGIRSPLVQTRMNFFSPMPNMPSTERSTSSVWIRPSYQPKGA